MKAGSLLARGAGFALLAALLLQPLFGSDYMAHLAVLTATFALLALSLDLSLGHTGMVSIAHAGLFGIGAYAAGLLTDTPAWSFWPGAVAGALLAAAVAAGMGLLFARMRGSYLAIGTFAFGELIRIVLNQWRDLTGGPLGLSIAAHPTVGFGAWQWQVADQHDYYALLLGLGLLLALGLRALLASRLGLALTLVRDDPELAAASGVPVLQVKVASLAIGGFVAGLVGGIYGAYMQFIAPESFSSHQSIQLVMIVVIGGAGTLLGPLLGAALIVLLPQALRIEPTVSLVVTGAILVAVVLLMPEGIAGRLARWRRGLRGRRDLRGGTASDEQEEGDFTFVRRAPTRRSVPPNHGTDAAQSAQGVPNAAS